MTSTETTPNELYAPFTMHFGIAGGRQNKEAAWSVQTDHNNAQTSMYPVTLPNYNIVSTQHSLQFWPFHDYLLQLPTMDNLTLHCDLPATITEYSSGNMTHQPIEESANYGTANIGHRLTQQTYYSPADTATSCNQVIWRSRFHYLFGHQPPLCQADGCKADLSNAKRYHRRHKVCEIHSKASIVSIGGGQQQRFCQQCSRFHPLEEFDEAKKSCRKRLADHNRRRRKQQPSFLSTIHNPQARSKGTLKKKSSPKGIHGTRNTSPNYVCRAMNTGKTGSCIIVPANSVSHLDGKKDQSTNASSSRIGSALAFGTVEEEVKPCMRLYNHLNHKEALHMFQDEDAELLQLQNQLSAFSHSTYHGAFQSTRAPDHMNYQQRSSLLQDRQLMFGLDFI